MASEAVQKAAKCQIGRDYPLPMINHVTASRTNMERMKQVYQQLAKYRNAFSPDGGGSAISSMLAKAQASALANAEQINSSPSPTTILKSVNSSGTYMCSTNRSHIDYPSPVIIYHRDQSPATTTTSLITQIPQPTNMMQHRSMNNNSNNNNTHHSQYLDENDDNNFQYHNVFNNYTQNQHQPHQVISETQQQADQHSLELRMNNLGNEQQDGD